MKDGYIKVAAVTPQVTVADVKENTKEILKVIREAAVQKAKSCTPTTSARRQRSLYCRSFALPDTPVRIYFCRKSCTVRQRMR